MTKIILSTFLIIFLTTSRKADTFDMYKGEIQELLRDPKTRKITNNENYINLNKCPIRFKMTQWKLSKYGNNNVRYIWDRDSSWFDGRIISSGGNTIDFDSKRNSNFLINQANIYPIYIGPWQKITLTHTEGNLFNSKEIKEEKQIRFFAYQPKEGGPIKYQYESLTEENKNIPEKEFSLSPTAKYAPDKFSLCVVKWTAKYG